MIVDGVIVGYTTDEAVAMFLVVALAIPLWMTMLRTLYGKVRK